MDRAVTNKVLIKFVGDSGDGIQIIGNQFSETSVVTSKNSVYTFVSFPPEIRAPVGSISGVSGYQLCISDRKIFSMSNDIDILIVMNPAGLKNSIGDLKKSGTLVVNVDSFTYKNLKKTGFEDNPLLDDTLSNFNVIKVSMTSLTYECVKDIVTSVSIAKRCKNFFALGLVYWLCDRELNDTINWIEKKVKDANIVLANKKALISGYNYGDTLKLTQKQYFIPPFI